MKNILRILAASILLNACTSAPIKPDEPVIPASPGKVLLLPEAGASKAESDKIIESEAKLREVVASACFYDFIKNRQMIQKKGKTNEEVAKHLQSLGGSVPVVMYYKRFTSAVAYRIPPSTTIYLNRRNFYPSLSTCAWVSTIGHESLGHALGEYEHDYNYSPSRDFSVPYSIGFAVDACCK
jgi:hypothetical protein